MLWARKRARTRSLFGRGWIGNVSEIEAKKSELRRGETVHDGIGNGAGHYMIENNAQMNKGCENASSELTTARAVKQRTPRAKLFRNRVLRLDPRDAACLQ